MKKYNVRAQELAHVIQLFGKSMEALNQAKNDRDDNLIDVNTSNALFLAEQIAVQSMMLICVAQNER